MRISSSDPLAARATPATVKHAQPELELEPWVAPAVEVAVDAALEQGLAARFVLPYPPSTNRLIRARAMRVGGKWMAQVYKTAEHRDYMAAVAVELAHLPLWAGPLSVRVKLYRPRRIGDIDGPIKALFDALNGRVWADDSQVVELHVTRGDDKHHPRVEVSIHAATTTGV